MDPKCTLRGRFDETIDHLVSGCPELAKTEYIHRQNKAASRMHWKMCKEFGIEVKERWYEHEPKSVAENDSVTTVWDMSIHTDRAIAANRPDIVLKNKKDKTCLLIDMTVSLHTNTSVKTTEKLTKYRLGNRGWANVGAQNNNSPGGYGSPWHKKDKTKKFVATSTYMNSRK